MHSHRKGRKPIRFVSEWKYDHEDKTDNFNMRVCFGSWFTFRGMISFKRGWHELAHRQVPQEVQWLPRALTNEDWPPVLFPRINAGLDLRVLFIIHELYLKEALEGA